MLVALGLGVLTLTPFPTTDSRLWGALLLTFAIPHLAAVVAALLGTRPRRGRVRFGSSVAEAMSDGRKG